MEFMEYAERRTGPRAQARELLARIDGYCLHRYGYVKDISSKGMRIRTFTTCKPYPFGDDKVIRIEFSLPEKDIDINCSVEPVWHEQPIGGYISTMLQGVRFTDIEPEALQEIEDWVMSRV